MLLQHRIWPFVAAMTLVVVASNILVQFPVEGQIGALSLADLLTWGAFTYPIAFLVTDLANRRYGPALARRVVYVGFAIAILSSITFPPLLHAMGMVDLEEVPGRLTRIAIASGVAFLAGQLLDVMVFNRLRRATWWQAPVFASILGSMYDTAVFFTIAFAPIFSFVGPLDSFALETSPLLGLFSVEPARWISWGLGDLGVKLAISVFALIPYRLIAMRWQQPAVA